MYQSLYNPKKAISKAHLFAGKLKLLNSYGVNPWTYVSKQLLNIARLCYNNLFEKVVITVPRL